MWSLAWPWMLLALPLPLIVRKLMSPVRATLTVDVSGSLLLTATLPVSVPMLLGV